MNETSPAAKKILIVDDDKLLRESLAKALADHGYQVTQASDGEEALKLALDSTPDLVITDVMMPNMDGLSMLQKMRTYPWGSDLPAIILTIKDSNVEIMNMSMRAGTAAYLSKADISPEQIVTLVKQQLQENT